MPSGIDATWPADGIPASKSIARANWAAAEAEINHGGFFTQSGTGSVERQSQDKLREVVSAKDFGALGDDSGDLVSEWLTGGTYSRGAANLTALRTMTGITDLELTDTIDWAAITAANLHAVELPVYLPAGEYRVARPLVFNFGGLLGAGVAAGSPTNRSIIRKAVGAPSSDVIQLRPTGANHHFFFKDFSVSGGTRGLHGDNSAGGGTIEQHSVFENLYFSGASAEGFFLEDLENIGGRYIRLKAENCGTHGLRFTGQSILNGAQIEGGRSVGNGGNGYFLENTHASGPIPGVVISGVIAESNDGAGINLTGYYATLVAPYFEQNDLDLSGEFDLHLASTDTTPTKVHTNAVVIQPYFATTNNPDNIVIGGTTGGPQQLVLIQPIMSTDGVVDTTHIELLLLGGKPNTFVVSGTRRPAMLAHPGLDLAGSKAVTTSATDLGIPAAPTFPAGIMQVLALHSDGTGASYLVRRNSAGTVTATFVAGTDFLTFTVSSGNIAAQTSTGTATVSVHGH